MLALVTIHSRRVGSRRNQEDQLRLKVGIVPLIKEIKTADGTMKTKLRPIALHDTPMKLIESTAFAQVADRIIAPMQTRHGAAVQKNVDARVSQSVEQTLDDPMPRVVIVDVPLLEFQGRMADCGFHSSSNQGEARGEDSGTSRATDHGENRGWCFRHLEFPTSFAFGMLG